MHIEFSDEAGDSFRQAVANITGYTARVTTETGETFDARLLGPDPHGDYYPDVCVVRVDEESSEPIADPETVRVERIYIY